MKDEEMTNKPSTPEDLAEEWIYKNKFHLGKGSHKDAFLAGYNAGYERAKWKFGYPEANEPWPQGGATGESGEVRPLPEAPKGGE